MPRIILHRQYSRWSTDTANSVKIKSIRWLRSQRGFLFCPNKPGRKFLKTNFCSKVGSMTPGISQFAWLVTQILVPRFCFGCSCGFLFGPFTSHRHLFQTQRSVPSPTFWGRGWLRTKTVRGRQFGMITNTESGSYLPPELPLEETLWLPVLTYAYLTDSSSLEQGNLSVSSGYVLTR